MGCTSSHLNSWPVSTGKHFDFREPVVLLDEGYVKVMRPWEWTEWKDFDSDVDAVMTRAFLTGRRECHFTYNGTKYECNFKKMTQVCFDATTRRNRRERVIRPPAHLQPPRRALLPVGPMVVVTVQEGQPGTILSLDDPNNPEDSQMLLARKLGFDLRGSAGAGPKGQKIHVAVPASASVGSQLAVPAPKKGQFVKHVAKTQLEMVKKNQELKRAGAKAAPIVEADAEGLESVVLRGFILGARSGGLTSEDAAEASANVSGEMIGHFADKGGTIKPDFVTDLL